MVPARALTTDPGIGALNAVTMANMLSPHHRIAEQTIGETIMNWKLGTAMGLTALAFAGHAAAQITFYQGEGFRGRAFSIEGPVRNFERHGFNDRASSVVVDRGRWEVCSDARFEGRCVVLRRGSYDSLARIGLNDRISSARPVNERARYDNETPPPPPIPVYEYRQRPGERTYEAPVTSVRAIVGPPEQRCWVERQQVVETRPGEGRAGDGNAGNALLGAIIGGVLGHQVGGGRGKDAATVAGVVAGAAIGSGSGRGDGVVTYDKNVQRCKTIASGRPEFWDVTYSFRGTEHHIQMSAPPGRTIAVNGRGEPRQ